MKIFITGSTGFVGNHVVDALLKEGHSVRALVRSGSEKRLKSIDKVEVVQGDITNDSDLLKGSNGCDSIIHLVGIIKESPGKKITFQRIHVEATDRLISAAKKNGVKRFVYMSALGARQDGKTDYFRTKFTAEELVRGSGLDYTIFRPTMIFGKGGEAVQMFAGMARKIVVPVVGNGLYRFNPVNVNTVAQGFERVLNLKESYGKTLELGGPDDLPFNEIMDTIADVLGKKIIKVHMPVFPLKLITSIMQYLRGYPLTTDQITMLLEGGVCDPQPFYNLSGLTAVSLEQTLREGLVNG